VARSPECRIIEPVEPAAQTIEEEGASGHVRGSETHTFGGFIVIACGSGKEALAAAPGANADLILLDVMMPGMDGPATLTALRAIPETARTPVIFMTAKIQASEILHYKSLGALDVVAKPFDPMTLSAQISEIWRRSIA